jgi:hypothetical protein
MEPSDANTRIPLQVPDVDERQFMINLAFPGQDQPNQRYQVSRNMPVRRFYHLIAADILGCADDDIRIYVDDQCLLHSGTVTDRFFPEDVTQLTVYLYPDCTAQVRRIGESNGGETSKPGSTEHQDTPPAPVRRTSTRISSKRDSSTQDFVPPRRAARDRWFYEPVPALLSLGSSSAEGDVDIPPLSRSIFDMERDGVFDDSPSSPTPSTEADTITLVARRERAILRSSSKETDTVLQVSRRERATLLREFKRCQRLDRRRYRSSLRALWYVELADDKENGSEAVGEVHSEDEAEALENYLFDKMMRYDGDSAFQLIAFRDTLQIQPERLGGPNAALIRDRTMNLWEGLRRVYFGISASSPAREMSLDRSQNVQASSSVRFAHDQLPGAPIVIEQEPADDREIAELRREIAELEERARRYRNLPDEGRPSPSYLDEDEDDDPADSLGLSSQAHALLSGTRGTTTGLSTTVHPPTDNEKESTQSSAELENFAKSVIRSVSNREKIFHGDNEVGVFDQSSTRFCSNGEIEAVKTEIDSHCLNGEDKFPAERDLIGELEDQFPAGRDLIGDSGVSWRKVFLSVKTLRRILNAKESIFKFGVFVPRGDKEADASPEHVRWSSGRTLEWMRL